MRTLHLHNSISIKRILFLWLALCMLPGIANATGKYFGSHYDKYDGKSYNKRYDKGSHKHKRCNKPCDNAVTVPLLVDQKIQVGVIKITYDEHRLNFKFVANDGWRIEKTHLAVSDSFEGIPQDKYGNAKLGRFPYKTAHRNPVQTVNQMLSANRWMIGSELYVAAHASVVAKNSKYKGKPHYEAKSWSSKWTKYAEKSDDQSSSAHDNAVKSRYSSKFVQRFFFGKDDNGNHRHGASCKWGKNHSKHKESYNESKSVWAKGYDFPGNMGGLYFTYLLKPCKPTTNSTIQFSKPTYTSNETDVEAKITITRSGDLSNAATVQFVTMDGTAIAGVDYVAVDKRVTFDPEVSQLDVLIQLIDDSVVEDIKTVNLQLLDVEGSVLGDQDTAILEIHDDDVMPALDSFIFEPDQYAARESDDLVILTVKRVGSLVGEATVDFAVTGGSAKNGLDYELMPGTLVFMDGEDTMTITIVIKEDRAREDDETVVVSLANPVNGELANPAEATLVIEDNDGPN
jgi:hypothetical protein